MNSIDESTMNVPRKACSIWAKEAFQESLNKIHWKNEAVIRELERQIAKLNLSEKLVNGDAVRGLIRSQEGRGIGISYTETFAEVVNETGDSHPINYLYRLLEKAMSKGMDGRKFEGFLSRGMRTFPSLLRDRDFALMMQRKIVDKGCPDIEIAVNPKEDATQHTDVLATFHNSKYRIWLFQYSQAGLPHNIERISGERGKLPTGIHILCPLKAEQALIYERAIRKADRLHSRLERASRPSGEKNGKTKRQKDAEQKALELSEQVQRQHEMVEALRSKLEREICIVNGWYFYSSSKIEDVLNLIQRVDKGAEKPENYRNVYDMLTKPKEYLSKISAFEV